MATVALNAHFVTGECHAAHRPFTVGNTHFTEGMGGRVLV